MLQRKKTFHPKFNNPLKNTLTLKGEEGPINLVEFRRDKIAINEEAIKILKEINNNIIIVSIFGKEHTGKSYLMNLLLNSRENCNKSKGFTVSTSMNARSSRGIWMWNTPIEKSDSGETIIFIDSGGINSENIYNQQSDSKIFAQVILMSSIFIYNTIGDINSNSLNELELIVQFADSFTVNSKINKDKLISELCPKFIWTLRDFDLTKLTNKKGEKITSDMYLENCLNERFSGKNKDEINMIKENFMYYFNDRECVTLPSPIEEENLYMLKDMKLNDLQEDFRQGIFTIKALTKYNKNLIDELKIKEKENENLTEQLNSILSENKNLKLKIIKSIENIPQIKMDSSKKDLNLNLKENLDNNENVHEEENYQRKNYFNINMRNNEKEVEKFKKNNYELDQLSNVKNIMDNMKKNKLKLKNAIEQHFINTKNIDNEN